MGFYLVEELEQGSSEWHAWRRGVIGASDASTIIGENKFKSQAYLGLGDERLNCCNDVASRAETT